ncbi:hypothetical protein [Sulfurovum riftiae]|uniref:Lipoprotein n=1 Tax=Sulfurovum riftiae TaxID=1630136 RepID=A0A151CGM8_9BACT|nr:hypothetical protein [Sulfurovum riftiae]KYJ86688.1 hypothetical protein AS592_07630 [Sulfurovum riftiae]
MLKKTTLLIATTLIFTGCNAVDEALNDIVSGDVDTETIKSKDKVLIINEVALSACAIIKTGLLDAGDFRNAEILVTEMGVTCATYGKTKGDPNDIDTACRELSLAVWLENEGHDIISDLGTAEGDRACVIGGDI